jgi:hypothetical protein
VSSLKLKVATRWMGFGFCDKTDSLSSAHTAHDRIANDRIGALCKPEHTRTYRGGADEWTVRQSRKKSTHEGKQSSRWSHPLAHMRALPVRFHHPL